MMKTTAAEIMSVFAAHSLIKEMVGPDRSINQVASVEDCAPGDLVFVDKAEYVAVVAQARPSVAVTSFKLKERLAGVGDLTLLVAPNVNLAQALIKQRYAGRPYEAAGWPRIHSSAVIHEAAAVPATAVIGRNVRIGERTRIMAGAVIEHDAQVGSDTMCIPMR